MNDIEKLAEDLHDLLADSFTVEMRDEKWQSTVVPKNARFFEFAYRDQGKDYAVITIGIFPNKVMKVFTDQSITDKMDDTERDRWYGFLKNLRMKIANPHRFKFDLVNFTKDKMQLRDMIQLSKDSKLVDTSDVGKAVNESQLYGTSRSSYQQLENVRIIVRHSKPVQEEQVGSRSRNIQKIFIETGSGERYLLPEGTTVNGARAYARHVKNGGTILDEFGQHIGKIIKEMSDLRIFVRNMRGKTFEDAETSAMVEAAIDHYGALHRDLFTMRGQKGYQQYKELWQPDALTENEVDIDALKERFTRKVFDERLMDALPIVAKAYKTRQDSVAEEFESWANEVTEDHNENDVNVDGEASPLSFSDATGERENDLDGDAENESVRELLSHNGFNFKFLNGTYWLESKQEVSRAKDIMAQADIDWNKIKFGVFNYGYGNGTKYGSTGWEYEAPAGKGVHEDISFIKVLAGLTK